MLSLCQDAWDSDTDSDYLFISFLIYNPISIRNIYLESSLFVSSLSKLEPILVRDFGMHLFATDRAGDQPNRLLTTQFSFLHRSASEISVISKKNGMWAHLTCRTTLFIQWIGQSFLASTWHFDHCGLFPRHSKLLSHSCDSDHDSLYLVSRDVGLLQCSSPPYLLTLLVGNNVHRVMRSCIRYDWFNARRRVDLDAVGLQSFA